MGKGNKKARERVAQAPDMPGVYLMKDASGKIIYVGKAVSLKKRLSSYFINTPKPPKTELLVSNISDIEWVLCRDEEEALLKEQALVKEHRPKYNRALKDDKSYPMVELSRGIGGGPVVRVVRRTRREGAEYFGPFVNAAALRSALKGMRFLYPYASCRGIKRSCSYLKIGLCKGPCVSEAKGLDKDYEKIRAVLMRDSKAVAQLVEGLMKRMNLAAAERNFEAAAFIRDAAVAASAVFGSGELVGGRFASLHEMRERFRLERLPRRIEGIDISNQLGDYSVGALVSFYDGMPDKKNYRRFKIKFSEDINDVAKVYEVVSRRAKRIASGEYPCPDLILIDGGRGHLNAAINALKDNGIETDVLALAKANEAVYSKDKRPPVVLPRSSAALRLLQFVRDEAHRFSNAYMATLRRKGLGMPLSKRWKRKSNKN